MVAFHKSKVLYKLPLCFVISFLTGTSGQSPFSIQLLLRWPYPFPVIDASSHCHGFFCLQIYLFLSPTPLPFPPLKILRIPPLRNAGSTGGWFWLPQTQFLNLTFKVCSKLWPSSINVYHSFVKFFFWGGLTTIWNNEITNTFSLRNRWFNLNVKIHVIFVCILGNLKKYYAN